MKIPILSCMLLSAISSVALAESTATNENEPIRLMERQMDSITAGGVMVSAESNAIGSKNTTTHTRTIAKTFSTPSKNKGFAIGLAVGNISSDADTHASGDGKVKIRRTSIKNSHLALEIVRITEYK